MIEVPVYDSHGQEVDRIKVDTSQFGGTVRYSLLKQSLVMYHSNKRAGTASTRGRSLQSGSGRKLYRQKGTGFARVGNSRVGKRVGGGVTFAKTARDFSQRMPKKQKRRARDSALLSKMFGEKLFCVEAIKFDKPRTRDFVGLLNNLQIKRSCLVAISGRDENLYKSGRNVPGVSVTDVSQLNAGDICRHEKILFTRDAFLSLLDKSKAEVAG